MASAPLAEGTRVRVLKYAKRPELEGLEAELGSYSKKDNTYECWMTDDKFEGSLAWVAAADFELVDKKDDAAKADGEADKASSEPPVFGVGDRVCGKESGQHGTVLAVDADGDPKVKMDGSSEAQQRYGKEFEIVSKAAFGVGDRVKGKDSGTLGTVVAVDSDGDPKVKLDGDDEAKQRFGKEFLLVEKAAFGAGDKVRGKDSGRTGVVVAVDSDGDPKVKMDDEAEAKQRYAKEFEIVTKAEKGTKRSRSGSKGNKKKKKKGEKESSSSSSSSESSSSGKKKKKKKKSEKPSVFGKSTLEMMADERRRKAKHERKHGKTRDSGKEAALSFLNKR